MPLNLPLLLLLLLLPATPLLAQPAEPAAQCRTWPDWNAFHNHYIQEDGRVIDFQAPPGITTSEGQAYSMFFALVANQPALFEKLLQWSDTHLAEGQLGQRLPAWLWGRDRQGRWRILDHNSATDADLWMAYSLLEASRAWGKPRYAALGWELLNRVRETLVVQVPGKGAMLLPGPYGFEAGTNAWMLNPSYAAPSLLQYFAHHDPQGPWQSLRQNKLDMLRAMPGLNLAPDWVRYDRRMGWRVEPSKESLGGYEAIRVYLWAGMMPTTDPMRTELINELEDMAKLLANQPDWRPPEYVNFMSGEILGEGPPGFSAALLPYLHALQQEDALQHQLLHLQTQRQADRLLGPQKNYYDQVLALFGLGWYEQRYQFGPQGQAELAWQADSCQSP